MVLTMHEHLKATQNGGQLFGKIRLEEEFITRCIESACMTHHANVMGRSRGVKGTPLGEVKGFKLLGEKSPCCEGLHKQQVQFRYP